MEELFRSKLHEALDAIQPPPGLRALNSIPTDGRSSRAAKRPQLELAFGLIAALLALAIVAGLMLSGGLHRSIPTRPGDHGFSPRPRSGGMVTPTIGWISGPAGHVFRTTDGSRHWNDVTPPNYTSNSISSYFLDANRAWITEDWGSTSTVVLRTSDGGRSWDRSTPITVAGMHSRGAISLFFLDSGYGWLLGGSLDNSPTHAPEFEFLYGTTDGGSRWHRLADTKVNSPGCPWNFVSFSTRTTGWITTYCASGGSKSELLMSHDGGSTWKPQVVPPVFGDAVLLRAPVFFDAVRGILAADNGGYELVPPLLTTSDGGQTWITRIPPGDVQFWGSFVDADHGWIVAGSSDELTHETSSTSVPLPLYRTNDGGTTWTLVKTDLTLVTSHGRVQDLYFIDPQIGFAVAVETAPYTTGARTLFETTDGGATWKVMGQLPTLGAARSGRWGG